MSGNSESQAADPAGALVTFWEQCYDQWNRQAAAALEAMLVAADPQQLQQRWLDALAQSCDDFLRSPAFLESMKQNLKATVDMKSMQDQLIQNAARQVGSPLANDITGLYERMQSQEQTILKRLKGIESRLKAIEARLTAAAAENGNGRGGHA